MNRQQILDNVDNLTAEQLFKFIRDGIINLSDLRNTGSLEATKRIAIQEMQRRLDNEDDDAWNKVITEADANDYLQKFPAGRNKDKAISFIDKMKMQREVDIASRADKIRKIKSNDITPDVVQEYISQGNVDRYILKNECNLPDDIIDRIEKYRPIYGDDLLGPTPANIPKGFTEVYFWGIPNSGKTCALSTILNTANKKGYMQTGEGAGLKYMHVLKNLYRTDDNIGYLLESSPDRTQYLPFTLKRDNEKYARSVSLIELSGEVFDCFLKKNIGEDLGALDGVFQTLNNYLTNENRKIHFFFIDYDPTSIALDNYTQSDYLEEASKYFTKHKIFSKSTDSIYVVITKSDLIEGYGTDNKLLAQNINKYLDENFKAFDNYLKKLCKDESINGGEYDIIPFSIGTVYCKRICKINRKPAEIIINLLFDRIQTQKKSILDVFNK